MPRCSLLDKMAESLHVFCLSDLKTFIPIEILVAIKDIDKSDYSLSEWSYALTYIFDTQITIHSLEEVEEILFKFGM